LNAQQIFFTKRLFLHLFHAFDENGDHQISMQELEQVCFPEVEKYLRRKKRRENRMKSTLRKLDEEEEFDENASSDDENDENDEDDYHDAEDTDDDVGSSSSSNSSVDDENHVARSSSRFQLESSHGSSSSLLDQRGSSASLLSVSRKVRNSFNLSFNNLQREIYEKERDEIEKEEHVEKQQRRYSNSAYERLEPVVSFNDDTASSNYDKLDPLGSSDSNDDEGICDEDNADVGLKQRKSGPAGSMAKYQVGRNLQVETDLLVRSMDEVL
jgi:hypothetical protein